MKLIVLNLPRDFTEDALAKLFKAHGNIKACNLVLDEVTGASKGFGFVEMALDHEGEIAIKALYGSKLSKNRIRVKPAE
jgi:RNA recognition motif-containing protein